ncbi:glycoside hydrolase family 10 protein [Dysgonomonas sp. 511]|uniref:glycoside hydrolase family 10 protein n=1 Tax=Dysgonomonas sp. 511 TaxID=2302930 RepID=UPI0013D1F43E|nr:family 10 glycosylhydrolase [Dysgonomonas sp. 511]NDV78112.1 hypothetical protein [Dysgonomonas sp. 511]
MKKLKYLLVTAFLAGFIFSCTDRDDAFNEANYRPIPDPGTVEEMPKKEFRAVWFTTVWNLDISKCTNVAAHKKEYTDLLDELVELNINTVVAQVRPKADAFWKSDIEPWSTWLSGLGVDPGYDPLAFWIEEAHKRGMELHAWFNPYDITTDKRNFVPAPGSAPAVHPEWTMEYPNGQYTRIMFRPSHPDVPDYLVSVIKEVADKYDIDGVHFDDYFYPYPEDGATLDDADDYVKYGAGYASIDDFRRGCVDKAIEKVSTMLKANHPDILFSISPFTDGPYNYNKLYADLTKWSQKGWVDFIVPQLYNGSSSIATYYPFETQLRWWIQNTSTPVVSGFPLYRVNNPSELNGKMNNADFSRQLAYAYDSKGNFGGFFYRAKNFMENLGDLQSVIKEYYKDPALRPFMGRATLPTPGKVTATISGAKLSWSSLGSDLKYVVYKKEDKTARIVTITEDTNYILSDSGIYFVSAVNKDNAEGEVSDFINFEE